MHSKSHYKFSFWVSVQASGLYMCVYSLVTYV